MKKRMTIRLSADLEKGLTKEAKKRGMTKNSLINYLVSAFLSKQTGDKEKEQ